MPLYKYNIELLLKRGARPYRYRPLQIRGQQIEKKGIPPGIPLERKRGS